MTGNVMRAFAPKTVHLISKGHPSVPGVRRMVGELITGIWAGT